MRKKSLSFLFILLQLFFVLPIFADEYPELDKKMGFRDMILEKNFNAFKNLQLLNSSKYRKMYVRKFENLKLGNYKLNSIHYSFYKNKLESIVIGTKGEVNSQGVLEILSKAYGVPKRNNEYIEEYYWFGKKVNMNYDQDVFGNALIIITSKYLSDIQYEEEQKDNEEAKKEL